MFKRILFLLLSVLAPLAAQDEFVPQGTYVPNYFAEILDAEMYSQDTVYAVGVGGFSFLNVSNMNSPQLIGRYDPGSIYIRFYNGIAFENLAIGAARNHGLYFLNISDLRFPANLKIHTNSGFSYESVDFRDGIAYAAVHSNGVEVLDISDPSDPLTLNMLSDLHNAWDVYIDGDHLYVADGAAGIRIYSLGDPASPQLVRNLNTSGTALEIKVHNGYAFVALGAGGFDIFDVNDPVNSSFVSNFAHRFGILNHLEISGTVLFAATWELVVAVDISDPQDPVLLATEDTPRRAMGLAAADNRVFVTDWADFRTFIFEDNSTPDIHVKPAVFDFGFRGAGVPVEKIFDIYNLGESALNISDITIENMYFTVDSAELEIPPGASGQFRAVFNPDESPNYIQNEITITSNDPDESEKNIRVFAGQHSLDPGDAAFEFTLDDLGGVSHSLSDYRGKIVVLAFFASW